MKRIPLLIILTSLLCNLAYADSSHQEKQIAYIQKEIAKYESYFIGKASVNKSSVKRSLRILDISRKKLDQLPNKSSPLWQAADSRYNKLIGQMKSLLVSSNQSSKQASKQTSSNYKVSTPASKNNKSSVLPHQSSNKQMISQYRVRIKKLKRDIESTTKTLDKGGKKPFQDENYVNKFLKSAQRYTASLNKFNEFSGDSDVIAASSVLTKFKQMIDLGQKMAKKDLLKLGDVQKRLKRINDEMHRQKIPATPNQPFKTGELGQWLVKIAMLRQTSANMFKPLPNIKKHAYLPRSRGTVESGAAFDDQDVDRIQRNLIATIKKIDTALKNFSSNLELNVKQAISSLDYYNKLDPKDSDKLANNFLLKGRLQEVRKQLTEKLQFLNEAADFSKRLKHKTYKERLLGIKKIKETQANYEENYKKALAIVRMPKAKSSDPALLKIAKEIIHKKHNNKEIKRFIINADKVHRSKDTSSTSIDDMDVSLSGKVTLSGTTTTYHYEWDQFQVATAEKEANTNKYYIYYTTLKYFTSGATTTPLNRWIISGRIQSSEIPKASIKLD